jgi:hypothetical protein
MYVSTPQVLNSSTTGFGGSRVVTWLSGVCADDAHLWASKGFIPINNTFSWADDADQEDQDHNWDNVVTIAFGGSRILTWLQASDAIRDDVALLWASEGRVEVESFSWADDAEDEESLATAFDIATVG